MDLFGASPLQHLDRPAEALKLAPFKPLALNTKLLGVVFLAGSLLAPDLPVISGPSQEGRLAAGLAVLTLSAS